MLRRKSDDSHLTQLTFCVILYENKAREGFLTMKQITIGLMAHVDAGKTSLAEAMLHRAGVIQKLGRVDHGNTVFDYNPMERNRGITIFSHQARFLLKDCTVTLLDTPGHVDFSAETERTMQVLDYTILVISGTDGVQSHTRTLWNLLERYQIPIILFVNKMDIAERTPKSILQELQAKLSPHCVDHSTDYGAVCEQAATCDENLMNAYLDTGTLATEQLADAIHRRVYFPCLFGSARTMQGVTELLAFLEAYTLSEPILPSFGASVFKISNDVKGNRLTFLKVRGGDLRNRMDLAYHALDGRTLTEKITGIRLYTGVKYDAVEQVPCGTICAVTGLSAAYAGQGLGCVPDAPNSRIVPVMRYRAILPESLADAEARKLFRILEEEDPQLQVEWDAQLQAIFVRLMGTVQLEVLHRQLQDRFGVDITFDSGQVTYRETIAEPVEGVGHYEPLRHYAEVHILLTPLPPDSGIQIESRVSEDVLDRNWQRLILTHIEEKQHIGVLTGFPITDIKLTLVAGKAHLKHTEGGDFRQATYRAVRQGLCSAQSILLEPYYAFTLELPQDALGRAMHDIESRFGTFSQPNIMDGIAILEGTAPVSEFSDYAAEVMRYTKGQGVLSLTVAGYRPCHNADAVIAARNYHYENDLDNSPDSIFCSHGAGYLVPWQEVPDHMHLPFAGTQIQSFDEAYTPLPSTRTSGMAGDDELMAIFERTYGKIHRDTRKAMRRNCFEESQDKPAKPARPIPTGPEYLLVDGYNILFAWSDRKQPSAQDLDLARNQLIQRLANYQGWRGCRVIVVFDAYRVKRHDRTIEEHSGIHVVYTKEAETADSYIEKVSHQLAQNYRVRVATSDALEQIIVLGNGAQRVSARELLSELLTVEADIRSYLDTQST